MSKAEALRTLPEGNSLEKFETIYASERIMSVMDFNTLQQQKKSLVSIND